MVQKKKHTDWSRDYRMDCGPKSGEVSFQVLIEETDLFIVAEKDLSGESLNIAGKLRGQIKAYMTMQPDFRTSLTPVDVSERAPGIIQSMAEASRIFHVGPMAAVAGSIAQAVADELAIVSPNVLVENGGDIFVHSTRKRLIGLLPVPDEPIHLGLALDPEDFPCALCSSSATIGHSLSLGSGDLVVVRAETGAVADAAATALANMLKHKQDLNLVLREAEKYTNAGIQGIFAQCGERIGVWGRMELVEI